MGFVFSPGIKRRPAAQAASLMILTVGVFMAIRAPTSNDTVVGQWQRSDAVVVAEMTSSGSLTMSGSNTIGGTFSGTTIHTLTGITLGDKDGAGCTTIYVLDGVVSAATDDCP